MSIEQLVIPKWGANGVLPPVLSGGVIGIDIRSPYETDTVKLVERFATSKERCQILLGLLEYRKALYQSEITAGFQWLNGSFMEQVEMLESRAPRDIDVVSFLDLNNLNQEALLQVSGDLFDQQQVKDRYAVDAYFIQIGIALDKGLTNRIAYWYSMWAHRRNGVWKGFLQIDFDPSKDAEARMLLQEYVVTYE